MARVEHKVQYKNILMASILTKSFGSKIRYLLYIFVNSCLYLLPIHTSATLRKHLHLTACLDVAPDSRHYNPPPHPADVTWKKLFIVSLHFHYISSGPQQILASAGHASSSHGGKIGNSPSAPKQFAHT